jgi:N-acetylmuramoyl-L-alanine amidase
LCCYLEVIFLSYGCLRQTSWSDSESQTAVEAPAPEPIPEPDYEEGALKTLTNLREEPSKRATVLKTLPAGYKVKIIEKTNDWYKVLCEDGTEGYIHAPLIKIKTSDVAPPKTYQPVNKPKTPFSDKRIYSTLKDSNMRMGPGTEYEPPIALIKAGTEFTSDGHTGKWYHGTANNKTGWIYSNLLNIDSSAPQMQNPNEQSAASSFSENTGEAIPSKTSQPVSKVQSESIPPTASKPLETLQNKSIIPPGKAKISSSTPVKLRAQMSQLSKVIEELPPGTEVTVLENQGNWYKIQTTQNIGYVPAGALTTGGN